MRIGGDEGKEAMQWRHWGCTTKSTVPSYSCWYPSGSPTTRTLLVLIIAEVLDNVKSDVGESAGDLDGYEDLPEALQEKINTAWQAGHIDPADGPVPSSSLIILSLHRSLLASS